MIINLSGGVNTSDATAVEANVLAGNTFYAQGVKKTGNLPEMTHTPGSVYPTDGNGNFGIVTPTRGIYPGGTILYANAAAAGITPEKILQGQSILGVAGTGAKVGSHCHSENAIYPSEGTALGLYSDNKIFLSCSSRPYIYYGAEGYNLDGNGLMAITNVQGTRLSSDTQQRQAYCNILNSAAVFCIGSHPNSQLFKGAVWTVGVDSFNNMGIIGDLTSAIAITVARGPKSYVVTDTDIPSSITNGVEIIRLA